VLVLLAVLRGVVAFRVVAPVVLSNMATPIPTVKGEKLPFSDSERQSPDVAFQPIPQQKSPLPVSETMEIEIPPSGITEACQRVHNGETVNLELTRLTILWAGIAVPRSIRTSATRYSVAVFIALVEAIPELSVFATYRKIIHTRTHCLDIDY
jgi:hypothetical protein